MYSRSENPTRRALENAIAELESGSRGFAFASGMAAISAVILAFTEQNSEVIAPIDIYGGSYRLLNDLLVKFGIKTRFIDMTDIEELKKNINDKTRIIFIETPSNPLLKITDIKKVVEIAKEKNIITAIDNTFLTPYLFRPLEHGIDITIHSASKYIGGHSDVIAGVVVAKNDLHSKKVYAVQNGFGGILGPEDSFLLLRGIKTLKVRFDHIQKNAIKIADFLKDQNWVKDVYFPGLASHPGHEIHAGYSDGPGGIVSFKTDSPERARKIMKNVRIWSVAVSLGGVESILSYPYRMSHNAMPKELKEKQGITEGLLRLSPGLEDADDLIQDLQNAAK